MTNHPNRNWRSKWQVDLSTCHAVHKSGLIVEFKQSDDGGWDGQCINLNDVKDKIDITKLHRILSEAGDIYKEHLDKRQ